MGERYLEHIVKLHDVLVAVLVRVRVRVRVRVEVSNTNPNPNPNPNHLLEKGDLAERALRVRRVLERVEDLLERHL